ncbi:MAG: LacI family transcriptional regulator [Bacteroidetes bacterium GWF2_42_66]|nr:MAG: LacI family transcriptional regulator [Bacteroidetes bacterium GWA2_42_15]OFY01044.1 MAG: LacI family transcriptional regulator [Bacteroidetes bacterium GWE2_42_39]OFY41885.1 MAG: LacI family transcriptional regulator [Bacteroidetes bacterium GWF2_42_66]HBL77937.1 LacI family transcriptional regulator [Prolixibacteraceae bacterium]HCU63418.1 LacI family transcriptional regulator [Prolixibacteraceae bacterium]
MKKVKITIKEMAERLNVSPSTISRALQNHPSIGKKMTAEVHKLAKKLGYYPNSVASNLRRNKTNVIGVIIPRIDRYYQSSAISGIEEVASKAGYYVIIFQSNNSYEREKENARMLLASQADGIIACLALETNNYDHLAVFKENNIPLVFFDRVCYEIETHKVIIDDFGAAVKATEHLISIGCRRIAHIAGNQKMAIFRDRLRGYQETLKKNNIPLEEELICFTEDLSSEEGDAATQKFIEMQVPPDGIFCSNDPCAIGVIQKIKKAGLSVPNNIAVVGFGNTPTSLIIEPALTTIDDHAFEMGQAAARMVIRQIEESQENVDSETIIIQNDLIIRDSTLK